MDCIGRDADRDDEDDEGDVAAAPPAPPLGPAELGAAVDPDPDDPSPVFLRDFARGTVDGPLPGPALFDDTRDPPTPEVVAGVVTVVTFPVGVPVKLPSRDTTGTCGHDDGKQKRREHLIRDQVDIEWQKGNKKKKKRKRERK